MIIYTPSVFFCKLIVSKKETITIPAENPIPKDKGYTVSVNRYKKTQKNEKETNDNIL